MLTPKHFDMPSGFLQLSKVGLTFQDITYLKTNLCGSSQFMLVVDEKNQNLTNPQQELLLWHQRLCHADMQQVQNLMQAPQDDTKQQILWPTIPSASNFSCLLCAACQLSKQGRRTPNHAPNLPPRMDIKQDDLKPGDCVSMDQYESSTPGRLRHTKGKEPKKDKFNSGTIFVDHTSGYIFLHNQVSLQTGKTLIGKHAFENFAKLCGVTVKKYRADNQPFWSAEFVTDIE